MRVLKIFNFLNIIISLFKNKINFITTKTYFIYPTGEIAVILKNHIYTPLKYISIKNVIWRILRFEDIIDNDDILIRNIYLTS